MADSKLTVLLQLRGARKFQKDAEESAKSVDRVGKASDRAGRSKGLASWAKNAKRMENVGSSLTRTVTAPLALGFGFAAKAGLGFEKQISALGAVSGASGKQLDALRESALTAGQGTAFSAQDVALAQTELAKAGLSLGQVMGGGVQSALALASAGELELGEAARYTANAMNLFAINGRDSMRVADSLAVAANTTSADVADFGMALTQSGSVAKSAGLSFNETMLALTALGKIGVQGSDAGTSLKTSLIQLIKPTAKQSKLTKELGLNFIDAQGKMKSMGEISGMMRGRLDGMTKTQRTATLATLAGTDGVRTLTALYDAGPKKLAKWAKGLQKTGEAAEQARKRQQAWQVLSASLNTLAIRVGETLAPALTRLADKATGLVDAFANLPKGARQGVVAFAAFAAAVGPVTWVLGRTIRGIIGVKTALRGMKGLFAKAFGRAGVVGAESAATSVAGNLGPQMGKRKTTLSRVGTTTGGIVGRSAGTTAATTAAAGMVGGGAAGGAGAAAAGGLGGKLAKQAGKFRNIGKSVGKGIGGGLAAGVLLGLTFNDPIVKWLDSQGKKIEDKFGFNPVGDTSKNPLEGINPFRKDFWSIGGNATGGLITQASHRRKPGLAGMVPRGDDTLTGAQYGEFMMSRSAVRQHGVAKLKAMNEGRATPVEPLQTNRVGGGDSKRTIILQVGRRELARVVDDEHADRAARR